MCLKGQKLKQVTKETFDNFLNNYSNLVLVEYLTKLDRYNYYDMSSTDLIAYKQEPREFFIEGSQ